MLTEYHNTNLKPSCSVMGIAGVHNLIGAEALHLMVNSPVSLVLPLSSQSVALQNTITITVQRRCMSDQVCLVEMNNARVWTYHHRVAPHGSPPGGTGLSSRPSKLRAARSAALLLSRKLPAAAVPLRLALMHICTAACTQQDLRDEYSSSSRHTCWTYLAPSLATVPGRQWHF